MTSGRLFASLALVALAPGAAAAQFTTFVAPPPRVDTVIVADARLTPAPTADSLARANINNMKAWVDSAAGNAVDLRAEVATAAPLPQPGYFADGSPAPNTATPLPLIVLLGASAIGAGTVLLRRR
ncbi:MAG: hypothetical protein H0X64_07110 [Gemmatimonadaceae bacterium]|nr:hypothetical protein [Gemmatimonadaceae bacterium]